MTNSEERITRRELEEYIGKINEGGLKDSNMELSVSRSGSVLNIEASINSKEKLLIYQGTVKDCNGFISGLERFYGVLCHSRAKVN